MRFLLAWLLCSTAFGQFGRTYVDAEQNISLGTATLVAPDIAVTCFHTIDGDNLRLVFGRQRVSAEVMHADKNNELAILRLSERITQRPIEVGITTLGERVRVGGFGGQENIWKYQEGIVMARGNTPGNGYTTAIAGVLPREGDSGGPVLNFDGKLVGVTWAQFDSDKETPLGLVYEPINELAKFLEGLERYEEVYPYLDVQREQGWLEREFQWIARERQLEDFIRANGLPALVRPPTWRTLDGTP